MPEVVFDSWLLEICLAWNVFVNIPFHEGAHIPSFTFQELWDANIWNINKLNVHFILPSIVYPGCPHQVHVWEKKLGGVLDMNGMGFFEPFPWLKGSRTNSYTKIIHNLKNIHHWIKTQNCNTYTAPFKSMLWLGIPIVILTSWYKIPIVPMYITYNICIMNPYNNTNFGNTYIELLNLPPLKMLTYAILALYFKPTMFESPM